MIHNDNINTIILTPALDGAKLALAETEGD